MFQTLLLALAFLASSLFLNVSAAPSPASGLVRRAPAPAKVFTKCKVNGTIAITFDDGPSQYIELIVAELKKFNATATFFVNGNNFGCIYDDTHVKRMEMLMKNGHQLASHTWSHANLSGVTRDQAHNQLWRIEEALNKTVGVIPNIVRPPYGEYNQTLLNVAGERAYAGVIMWDYDSGDSSPVSELATTTAIFNRYKLHLSTLKKSPMHALVLNHDVKDTAAPVLALLLPVLKKMKLKPVTVAECLGLPVYQKPVNKNFKAKRDSSWTCTGKPQAGKP